MLGTVLLSMSNAPKRALARAAMLSAVAAVAAALLCLSAYASDALGAPARACSGKQVHPSMNLSSVANKAPRGQTFCLHDGTYKVSSPVPVQSGDVFAGVYSDSTQPHITTSTAHEVFAAGGSDGAMIRDLKVSGAVGNNRCEPDCGRGISGGKKLTVLRVHATKNMNAGVGGTGPGLLVKDSVMDYNGSRSFSIIDGGPSSSAGIKSVSSLTVVDSYIHHNYWNGVWCDGECNAFRVEGSTLTDNGKAGIHNEASTGPALIANNTILRNGWNDTVPMRRAGVLIVDSDRVEVRNNTFDANRPYGVQVDLTKLGRLHRMADVSVHHNTMNGDLTMGCSLSGVTCLSNK